jgi:hypothetical protein
MAQKPTALTSLVNISSSPKSGEQVAQAARPDESRLTESVEDDPAKQSQALHESEEQPAENLPQGNTEYTSDAGIAEQSQLAS